MSISSVTSATSTASDPITGLAMNTNAGKQTLEADDFMKLLTTQLTSQDPMNPMEDTEFISQMANFTSLEQMRALSSSFSTFTSDQKMATAPSFLGRQVTVSDAAGDVTGVVDAIALKNGIPAVVINGKSYETSRISGITQAPAAQTTTPVATTAVTPQS
jgi:flagellar basal-body rod modification protein FlgD